ncbi:hypothetical protein GCM10020256_67060 [Streptomyces thermocoprophilus]
MHEAGESLRTVGNLHTVAHQIRDIFTVTPQETEEDWAALAERLRAVPAAFAGYRESLALGLERELYGAPRPTATFIGQLDEWADTGEGRGWFEDFAAAGPEALRAELDGAARAATASVVELRDWMRDVYAPRGAGRAGHRGPGAVPASRPLLHRRRPGPRRGVRLRLGGVSPAARRDAEGGREDPARRRLAVGGARAPRRARAAHRGRGGGPRLASGG